MKPSRFTEEQIIGILRERETGAKTADVCRKHGLSSATFCKWKDGSEFLCMAMPRFNQEMRIECYDIAPGKPTDNAFIEAFNGRFRAECPNARWFLYLADVREKMEDWRNDDNEERPPTGRSAGSRRC